METNGKVAQEGEFKMNKKRGRPKKLHTKEDGTIKVDLSKKEETTSDEPTPDAEKKEITKEKSAGLEPKIAAESIKETTEEEETVDVVPEESDITAALVEKKEASAEEIH